MIHIISQISSFFIVYEIKYYTTVEEVADNPSSKIRSLINPIWVYDYVKNYFEINNTKIWILRAYKLDNYQYI